MHTHEKVIVMPSQRRGGRRLRRGALRWWRPSCALFALTVAAGCDIGSLLDVDIPGRVPADALDNPSLASTLALGAQADFECAWSEYVLAESMFTDEFIVATSIVTVTTTDARTAQFKEAGGNGCTTDRGRRSISPYRPVQTARFQAEDVYERISGFSGVANQEPHLARLALYAGYMYTLLGEGYCDASVAVNGGPRETKQSLWTTAETWFTTTLNHAQSAGLSTVATAATVGRARVRLNLGNTSGAVTDAQTIPEDFTYLVTRDATVPSRDNQIYQQSGYNNHHSVDPLFRNLTIDASGNATQGNGTPDPRVPVHDGNRLGEDGFTPMWYQDKYTSLSTGYPLATWREAVLIIAEVSLGQTAVDMINLLRDKRTLPHYTPADVNDDAEVLAAVIEEKRRETFAEGHRISELQRHDLPWQEGVNHRGLTYGPFHCFPEFFSESQNNPNF